MLRPLGLSISQFIGYRLFWTARTDSAQRNFPAPCNLRTLAVFY